MCTIKIFAIIIAVAAVAGTGALLMFRSQLGGFQMAQTADKIPSFYTLQTRTLEGEPADLALYKGEVALVVNLASKCGFTPQYAGLEALYKDLSRQGFVVLGFPSNDFMGQEPGTPAEIRDFCSLTYGVSFPLFEKVKVKGDHKDPVYRLLTANLDEPDWNFTKYLVDRQGRIRYRFGPRVKPDDADLQRRIKELLAE